MDCWFVLLSIIDTYLLFHFTREAISQLFKLTGMVNDYSSLALVPFPFHLQYLMNYELWMVSFPFFFLPIESALRLKSPINESPNSFSRTNKLKSYEIHVDIVTSNWNLRCALHPNHNRLPHYQYLTIILMIPDALNSWHTSINWDEHLYSILCSVLLSICATTTHSNELGRLTSFSAFISRIALIHNNQLTNTIVLG